METQVKRTKGILTKGVGVGVAFAALLLGVGLMPKQALAVPAFARQTGQNCVACHAGGQFPELTPYGRMFKLTGYTIGQRTIPVSVMGLASVSSIATAPDGTAKQGKPILATGSLFLAGKVTDNIGGFAQITYDKYAVDNGDGSFSGHSNADNIDLRVANRTVDAKRDWVYGVSLNNNPSISDPWNTAAAWMQYVPVPSPSSSAYLDGAATPYPGFGSGGNIAGLNGYVFWNQMVYAELGTYRTASKAMRFMSAGINSADITQLSGSNNPYWRLALSHEWGPHNIMVGAAGMTAHRFEPGTDTGDSTNINIDRNTGIDAQYQYLLDPHTVTVQFARMHQRTTYADSVMTSASLPLGLSDTTNVSRAKASYVYMAKYGGSLALFSSNGSTNNQGDPATTGATYEAFYTPMQNIRVGLQYTAYRKFEGATDNYDGAGRNAKDNNSLFLYAWFAY